MFYLPGPYPEAPTPPEPRGGGVGIQQGHSLERLQVQLWDTSVQGAGDPGNYSTQVLTKSMGGGG